LFSSALPCRREHEGEPEEGTMIFLITRLIRLLKRKRRTY
jgi:hypothetical protein